MITTAAITFLINALTSFLKKYIYPRYGKFGVHVILFILASVGAAYLTYGQSFAPLQTVVEAAIALFCLAVTLYEVLLSRFSVFKTTT